MCKSSKAKLSTMEAEKFQEQKNGFLKSSILLELAAADDVSGFKSEVESKGLSLDEVGFWYGRRNGSKRRMGFEERTPLMIASMYGSNHVLKYLIDSKKIDVNKASESDGATALHCAAAGGCANSGATIGFLLYACANPDVTDDNGYKPVDLMSTGFQNDTLITETEIVSGKKEYSIGVSLPDINEGVYGTDEFRMFTFKVKPCSRAYSHDWTECPFVHPGENARRRDPAKYTYTCVPCPEFRKGSCVKGDNCEYAHGVFESWLHPAQYRTRLCKDETGCARKVCFFAHKVDELRPLYASTGSAVPSPKSGSVGSVEMGSTSPIGLGSGSSSGSTPPKSPLNGWQNKFVNSTPPALQLPGSRLKTSLTARDLEIELELLGLENIRTQRQQRRQLIDDLSNNLFRQNSNNLYRQNPTSFGFDSSAAVAQAVMNSRSGAFAKQRSQSFIDRSAGVTVSPRSMPTYSGWGSPTGKLEWGFNGDEANKLRKSASFGFGGAPVKANHEPDGSWVGAGLYSSSETVPQWVEQMYKEQEQLMA